MYVYAVSVLVAYVIIWIVAFLLFSEHNRQEKKKAVFSRKYVSLNLGHVFYYLVLAIVWPITVFCLVVGTLLELANYYSRN